MSLQKQASTAFTAAALTLMTSMGAGAKPSPDINVITANAAEKVQARVREICETTPQALPEDCQVSLDGGKTWLSPKVLSGGALLTLLVASGAALIYRIRSKSEKKIYRMGGDGWHYIGEKNDKNEMHGEGKYFDEANQSTAEGIFKNNSPWDALAKDAVGVLIGGYVNGVTLQDADSYIKARIAQIMESHGFHSEGKYYLRDVKEGMQMMKLKANMQSWLMTGSWDAYQDEQKEISEKIREVLALKNTTQASGEEDARQEEPNSQRGIFDFHTPDATLVTSLINPNSDHAHSASHSETADHGGESDVQNTIGRINVDGVIYTLLTDDAGNNLGTITQGSDGKYVVNGKGTIRDGEYEFNGYIKDNKRHGHGTEVHSKYTITGTYSEGREIDTVLRNKDGTLGGGAINGTLYSDGEKYINARIAKELGGEGFTLGEHGDYRKEIDNGTISLQIDGDAVAWDGPWKTYAATKGYLSTKLKEIIALRYPDGQQGTSNTTSITTQTSGSNSLMSTGITRLPGNDSDIIDVPDETHRMGFTLADLYPAHLNTLLPPQALPILRRLGHTPSTRDVGQTGDRLDIDLATFELSPQGSVIQLSYVDYAAHDKPNTSTGLTPLDEAPEDPEYVDLLQTFSDSELSATLKEIEANGDWEYIKHLKEAILDLNTLWKSTLPNLRNTPPPNTTTIYIDLILAYEDLKLDKDAIEKSGNLLEGRTKELVLIQFGQTLYELYVRTTSPDAEGRIVLDPVERQILDLEEVKDGIQAVTSGDNSYMAIGLAAVRLLKHKDTTPLHSSTPETTASATYIEGKAPQSGVVIEQVGTASIEEIMTEAERVLETSQGNSTEVRKKQDMKEILTTSWLRDETEDLWVKYGPYSESKITQEVRNHLESAGGRIDVDADGINITLTAPEGKFFYFTNANMELIKSSQLIVNAEFTFRLSIKHNPKGKKLYLCIKRESMPIDSNTKRVDGLAIMDF